MWEKKKAPEHRLICRPRERGQSLSQIEKSLKLKGEITGNEDLYIDGEVEGRIELQGTQPDRRTQR